MPGQQPSLSIKGRVFDDNYYEKYRETLDIGIEVVEQSLQSRIKLNPAQDDMLIQDNDGWFA